jgi:integrase
MLISTLLLGSIARRPDGTWRARYRGPDKRERSRHFTRKSDAERWLAGVEVSKSRGEWIDPNLSRVTVGEWARLWLAAQSQLKPTTIARYGGIIDKHIAATWGQVAIADVTPADVAAWLQRLVSSGLAAGSVRYIHRILSLALAYAVLDGRLTRNPAAGVPLPRAKARPKRFLSHGELARLADECGDYGALINSLGYTGLRWGEAVALQVEDLDLLRRRIRVTRAMAEVRGKAVIGTPKDHERRDVPIPAFLVDDLADLVAGRPPTELVFPSPKGSILRNGNFRRNVFDTAAKRAGLEGITPHGLRHTAASLAIQAGATVVVVSRMLGHSSAKVTLDVYAHLFADDLDTVADRLHEARARASADQMRTSRPMIFAEDRFAGGQHAV